MLHMSASFSGGTVASHMADDEEEFAEFLREMADAAGPSFIADTAEYFTENERERVCHFLRKLTAAIEAS